MEVAEAAKAYKKKGGVVLRKYFLLSDLNKFEAFQHFSMQVVAALFLQPLILINTSDSAEKKPTKEHAKQKKTKGSFCEEKNDKSSPVNGTIINADIDVSDLSWESDADLNNSSDSDSDSGVDASTASHDVDGEVNKVKKDEHNKKEQEQKKEDEAGFDVVPTMASSEQT